MNNSIQVVQYEIFMLNTGLYIGTYIYVHSYVVIVVYIQKGCNWSGVTVRPAYYAFCYYAMLC